MKKNLKKRAVGVTVALVMAASVVACGAKDSGETNSVSASESSDITEDVVEESAENESLTEMPPANDDDEIRETISGAELYYVKIISLDDTSVTFLNLQADDEKYADYIFNGIIDNDNWTEYAHTYKLPLSSNVYFDDEVSAGDNAIISVVDDQVYNFCAVHGTEDFLSYDY